MFAFLAHLLLLQTYANNAIMPAIANTQACVAQVAHGSINALAGCGITIPAMLHGTFNAVTQSIGGPQP